MKLLLSLILVFGFSFSSLANDKAEIIMEEFNRFKAWAETAETDGEIGNLYPYVQENGYVIMFSKKFDGKHERIRFFMKGDEEQEDFSVDYIRSVYFREGKVVLRRFVGTELSGWRRHEVDYEAGTYLGRQGYGKPTIPKKAKAILKKWNITLLN